MTKAIYPTSWFYNLYNHSQSETYSKLPSKLEFVLLMDSGASISVLNLPTFLLITQTFNVCDYDQQDISKTLTNANESKVLNKHYISVTCFPSIESKPAYIDDNFCCFFYHTN